MSDGDLWRKGGPQVIESEGTKLVCDPQKTVGANCENELFNLLWISQVV